jgi:Mn2+/Fe2+ NRAMP family transporter
MHSLESITLIPKTDLEDASPGSQGLPQPSRLLLILSFGLVAAGLLVLAALLFVVYETFNDPMSNKLVTDFSKELATHPLILSSDASSIRIGEGAANLLAMLLFVLFAGMVSLIGCTPVWAGVQVLPAQVQPQIEEWKERLETVVQHFRR